METNDRMVPGAYDLPDAYRCLDCEALVNPGVQVCDECLIIETIVKESCE